MSAMVGWMTTKRGRMPVYDHRAPNELVATAVRTRYGTTATTGVGYVPRWPITGGDAYYICVNLVSLNGHHIAIAQLASGLNNQMVVKLSPLARCRGRVLTDDRWFTPTAQVPSH